MRLDVWTLVRFVHIVSAILWVGGQLTLTAIVRPAVVTATDPEQAHRLISDMGRRFALVANVAALPLLIATGIAMMLDRGVDAQMLTATTYGQTLVAKLALVLVVIAMAAGHGVLATSGRARAGRALAMGSLLGSLGIVLLATSLTA